MIQRRKFLKQLGIALPGTILIPSILSSCKKEIDFPTTDWAGKIIIIGAGASGIYSAYILKKYAKNATIEIHEASNTYGGRIKELDGFADFKVELGAEEVHGKNSKWYEIVDSTNATFTDTKNELDFIMLDSTLKDEDEAKNDNDYNKAVSVANDAASYSGAEINCELFAQNNGVPSRTMHVFNALTGNEYGTSASKLSANGISAEDNLWSSGEQSYNLANRSYYSILNEKYDDIISHIKYNSQIIDINYSNETIVLKNQNGTEFFADKVIVTVPIKILKRGDINFIPTIPSEKTNAMNNIGMDSGMKIIIKFSTRFWDANCGSIKGNGVVPEYWYSSKGRGNDHVLTAFVMGDKAAYLSTEGANAINLVLADLDTMYGSGVASGSMISHHICDWSKEPFIGGSYSYAMNKDIIAHRTTLSKNINNKIYFAGEATHIKGHNSTVHGAIETAENVSKEILDELA